MKTIAVLALSTVLVGCSTYAVPRYSISTDTVVALRAVGDVKASVGDFRNDSPTNKDSQPGEIMCRAVGPIKTPDGESYADYVRKALISELIIANIYEKESTLELTGRLTTLDFDSMGGTWTVGMELSSSNGKSIAVNNTHKYTSSFYGETACNQTAQAGLGAIQDAIRALVTHADFKTLLAEESR
ncbi:hypothetical protein AB6N01_03340 [Alcaligenes nematophilus]|uniref:hypothetical protein n=1 Tax=Alcaligenes TaxID=507 RepID=UPI0030180053